MALVPAVCTHLAAESKELPCNPYMVTRSCHCTCQGLHRLSGHILISWNAISAAA